MDKIDKELLRLLTENARMPLNQLAQKVFLSSPAVASRIEKLEREQKQIDQIIREIDPKRVHEYYEVQEAILESLDQEHKEKFEALIDDLVAWGEEECKAVYIAAFFEGLRLGHKVF